MLIGVDDDGDLVVGVSIAAPNHAAINPFLCVTNAVEDLLFGPIGWEWVLDCICENRGDCVRIGKVVLDRATGGGIQTTRAIVMVGHTHR
jgi:hypothetical protein